MPSGQDVPERLLRLTVAESPGPAPDRRDLCYGWDRHMPDRCARLVEDDAVELDDPVTDLSNG